MKTEFHYSLNSVRKILTPNSFPDWSEDFTFENIVTSSMEADEKSLFVPLQGVRDGHDFIQDALNKGTKFFLCKKNHPVLKKFKSSDKSKAILVDDTLNSLGKLANFHRKRFTPLLIAITGSSGKTTTKELLGHFLSKIGSENLVITEKNYNNEIGLPFTLFRINEKTKIAVCELGMNHLKEIERLSDIAEPDISVITSIGSAHIEHLGSLKNIAEAKSEILNGMKKDGIVFVHSNLPFQKTIQQKAKLKNVFIKTIQPKNKKILTIVQKKETGFLLKVFSKKVEWNILGEKSIENLNLVLNVLNEIHFPKKEILSQIQSFKNPEKRFIIEKNIYTVINDTYNANPESMISSLDSSIQLSGKKNLYAVLGDMKELGKFSKIYHTKIGRVFKDNKIKGLITFGKDSKYISQEFIKYNKNQLCKHFDDSTDSINAILSYIQDHIPKKSILLVKGSRSMKMERITEALSNLNF